MPLTSQNTSQLPYLRRSNSGLSVFFVQGRATNSSVFKLKLSLTFDQFKSSGGKNGPFT
jgi:hypothetical protein